MPDALERFIRYGSAGYPPKSKSNQGPSGPFLIQH